jgi:hypothetical protein
MKKPLSDYALVYTSRRPAIGTGATEQAGEAVGVGRDANEEVSQ